MQDDHSPQKISRRNFLKTASKAAASLAVPRILNNAFTDDDSIPGDFSLTLDEATKLLKTKMDAELFDKKTIRLKLGEAVDMDVPKFALMYFAHDEIESVTKNLTNHGKQETTLAPLIQTYKDDISRRFHGRYKDLYKSYLKETNAEKRAASEEKFAAIKEVLGHDVASYVGYNSATKAWDKSGFTADKKLNFDALLKYLGAPPSTFDYTKSDLVRAEIKDIGTRLSELKHKHEEDEKFNRLTKPKSSAWQERARNRGDIPLS